MKLTYIVAVLISLVGISLLVFGVSDSEQVSLFGLLLHTRVAKGVGIVSMILGIIAFMVAYGASQPPSRLERRH